MGFARPVNPAASGWKCRTHGSSPEGVEPFRSQHPLARRGSARNLRSGSAAPHHENEPTINFDQVHPRHQSKTDQPKMDGETIAPIDRRFRAFCLADRRRRSRSRAQLDGGNRRGEKNGLSTHEQSPPEGKQSFPKAAIQKSNSFATSAAKRDRLDSRDHDSPSQPEIGANS